MRVIMKEVVDEHLVRMWKVDNEFVREKIMSFRGIKATRIPIGVLSDKS